MTETGSENMQGFLHGGDYNPEQWLHMPEILEQDIQYLKQAHCNEVTLGVFAWSALEPEEGEYRLEWMEEIIDRMYQNGISVILATPSGARPKWMADRYPEILRVSEDGHRNYFGGRHNHCYTSPVYREKVRKINRKLAERFGKHPAVRLWHVSNEYGGECYCQQCQEAFRRWLKERYHNSIEELNLKWCTQFWSHTYQSFEQIEAPSSRGESALHALTLEWKRFVTEQTCNFLREEIAALREGGSTLPVTTNMMYRYAGLDYRRLAKEVDLISWDTYPTWHKEALWKTAADCAMQHDYFRSLKKQPFLLMESSPSSTNWQPVSKLRKPGMIQAAALQAIAHGSESVLYFQIRQSQGASEKFHGAVIDHYGGCDTRVFAETAEVGKSLEQLRECAGSVCESQVAVWFETDNRWALDEAQGPRNEGMHFMDCVQKVYEAFRRQGVNVDLIGSEDTLEGYRIVAVPMGYMLPETFAQKLAQFTANGGTLLLTYWSSIVDEQDRCYLGGTPHGLREVLGLRSMEIDGLYEGEENVFADAADGTERYSCRHLCELVKPEGAEVLMVYGRDFYQGMPAVTRNTYGSGQAYYVCADAEARFYEDLAERMVIESGTEQICGERLPEGLEVTERVSEEYRYVFLQNYAETAQKIPAGLRHGWECLYGGASEDMDSLETRVYKKKRCSER